MVPCSISDKIRKKKTKTTTLLCVLVTKKKEAITMRAWESTLHVLMLTSLGYASYLSESLKHLFVFHLCSSFKAGQTTWSTFVLVVSVGFCRGCLHNRRASI